MRNPGSSKKYTEGFVAWNERPRLQGEAQSVGDRTSMSGRGILKKKTSFPSSSEYVRIQPPSHTEQTMGVTASADNLQGLHEGLELNMTRAVGNSSCPDGQVRTARQGKMQESYFNHRVVGKWTCMIMYGEDLCIGMYM